MSLKNPEDQAGPAVRAGEVEITPEMMAAGLREFCAYDARFEGPEDVVPEIFRAMLRAQSNPGEVSGAGKEARYSETEIVRAYAGFINHQYLLTYFEPDPGPEGLLSRLRRSRESIAQDDIKPDI